METRSNRVPRRIGITIHDRNALLQNFDIRTTLICGSSICRHVHHRILHRLTSLSRGFTIQYRHVVQCKLHGGWFFSNWDLRPISVTFPLGTADIYILDEQGDDEGSVELSFQVIFPDGCYQRKTSLRAINRYLRRQLYARWVSFTSLSP